MSASFRPELKSPMQIAAPRLCGRGTHARALGPERHGRAADPARSGRRVLGLGRFRESAYCCKYRRESFDVSAKPIVCLTEETVETLYLLGEQDRTVGISGYCVGPPQARREKPRVSAFTSANIPKILATKPDLVFAFSDLQARSPPSHGAAGRRRCMPSTNAPSRDPRYDPHARRNSGCVPSGRGAWPPARCGPWAKRETGGAPLAGRWYIFEEWDDRRSPPSAGSRSSSRSPAALISSPIRRLRAPPKTVW